MIGPYFNDGERVLDLFAGTGGLGIEALSRGADSAVFIDSSPQSIEIVRRNLESTRLAGRAAVYRNEARRALKVLARAGEPFDLIFLDPPYAMKDCDAILMEMAKLALTAEGAFAVIEHHPDVVYADAFGGYTRSRYAVYGEIAVSIYRYAAEEADPSEEEQEANANE
jgi:16S rRNA (guanine(966)-N(2))-methyltransferase RsmD